jgi:ribonuclease HII
MDDNVTYIIGIDEAGRGPIAGPVAVGACKIEASHLAELSNELVETFMRGKLKDSKKLSEKKRAEIYAWMQNKQKAGKLSFAVSMGASKTIDREGIVPTINKAVSKVLTILANGQERDVLVKLDGGLKAPDAFKNQETLIRGDETEVAISLASIAAKVTRDKYMKRLSESHNAYGFDKHKGYGTRAHYEAIDEHGLISEHRRSFCKNIK